MKSMILDQAIETFLDAIRKRPDKYGFNNAQDLEHGRRPRYCPVTIVRFADPDEPPVVPQAPRNEEERLANWITGLTRGLEMENSIPAILRPGIEEGTGFMTIGFGVKLSSDPAFAKGVAKHFTLEEVERLEPLFPEKEERFQRIKEQIDFYAERTPGEFRITLPDMQGPFNIAHSILGAEIFTLMYDQPAKVHFLMDIVTDYFIKVHVLLKSWIPASRWDANPALAKRIAECSCNLISKDAYKEFVAPYDRRIVDLYGAEVAFHICSGAHVFEATLETFAKEMRETECGIMPYSSSGYLTVEQGLDKLRGRNVVLSILEELTAGREEETIKKYLGYMRDYPTMRFQFSGLYWRKKDDRFIKDLHKRVDEYYYKLYGGGQ